MRKAAGIGPPDVVKAPCPVRGALGGNPLSRGSTDAVLRLHEFITALFYEVDEQLGAIPKHPAAGATSWRGGTQGHCRECLFPSRLQVL